MIWQNNSGQDLAILAAVYGSRTRGSSDCLKSPNFCYFGSTASGAEPLALVLVTCKAEAGGGIGIGFTAGPGPLMLVFVT